MSAHTRGVRPQAWCPGRGAGRGGWSRRGISCDYLGRTKETTVFGSLPQPSPAMWVQRPPQNPQGEMAHLGGGSPWTPPPPAPFRQMRRGLAAGAEKLKVRSCASRPARCARCAAASSASRKAHHGLVGASGLFFGGERREEKGGDGASRREGGRREAPLGEVDLTRSSRGP